MPSIVINLYYIKVNSISGNGSITIGEATHNSHTASNKSQGINSSYGDTSPTEAMMENIFIDPDVNDQSAIGNTDTANVNMPGQPLPPNLI
ncbi:spore germination protein [Bacillus sp. FJAT-49705]|uniref:Spore germination protein n=1 Tax=Cytobacillus citreus TaxID=2833586 RepID=A0ABS5NY24_9BACI|nr:spore germination protein [Cytobacillus citreus]MBS4192733.1 spore germination protein [Cytobacillus citreus]